MKRLALSLCLLIAGLLVGYFLAVPRPVRTVSTISLHRPPTSVLSGAWVVAGVGTGLGGARAGHAIAGPHLWQVASGSEGWWVVTLFAGPSSGSVDPIARVCLEVEPDERLNFNVVVAWLPEGSRGIGSKGGLLRAVPGLSLRLDFARSGRQVLTEVAPSHSKQVAAQWGVGTVPAAGSSAFVNVGIVGSPTIESDGFSSESYNVSPRHGEVLQLLLEDALDVYSATWNSGSVWRVQLTFQEEEPSPRWGGRLRDTDSTPR